MSADDVKRIIREDVTKSQLIDIADTLRSTRKTAGQHASAMGLAGRSASRIAGFGAYELQNIHLPALTIAHGGTVIDGENFPGTELRTYQPISQFGRTLIGKASIPDPGELPTQNLTRANGAKVNVKYATTGYLFGCEPAAPTEDVIYVLLLTCRDRHDPEAYAEVAIAALEPDFSGYIFYELLDAFVAGYADGSAESTGDVPATPIAPDFGLALRKGVSLFQGSETPDELDLGATGADKKSP